MGDSSTQRDILVFFGPAGCGKSTMAASIASLYGFAYIEGDDYHSQDAVKMMTDGCPLNDGDRWDWLIRLRKAAQSALNKGSPGVVISCSALKKKYRDVLRILHLERCAPFLLSFVYLRVDQTTLRSRVALRQGHYMKDGLVRSQLGALEEPDDDELAEDVFVVDANGSMHTVLAAVKTVVSDLMTSKRVADDGVDRLSANV